MQITNVPAPDDDRRDLEDNFDTTSDFPDVDKTDPENADPHQPDIPVPPDSEPNAPIDDPPVEEGDTRKRIV